MKDTDSLVESVTSLLVRVSSLEDLLISKGILNQEEYVEDVKSRLDKMAKLLKEAIEKQNNG